MLRRRARSKANQMFSTLEAELYFHSSLIPCIGRPSRISDRTSFLSLQFSNSADLQQKEKERLLAPPARERGLRRNGYTIAGYPFAFFGVPTIIHSKQVELSGDVWREKEADCGGLMKVTRVWVNDLPLGYEIVLGMQCQDCKYTDS